MGRFDDMAADFTRSMEIPPAVTPEELMKDVREGWGDGHPTLEDHQPIVGSTQHDEEPGQE